MNHFTKTVADFKVQLVQMPATEVAGFMLARGEILSILQRYPAFGHMALGYVCAEEAAKLPNAEPSIDELIVQASQPHGPRSPTPNEDQYIHWLRVGVFNALQKIGPQGVKQHWPLLRLAILRSHGYGENRDEQEYCQAKADLATILEGGAQS